MNALNKTEKHGRSLDKADTNSEAQIAPGWLANISAQALPFIAFITVTPLLTSIYGPAGYGALSVLSILPVLAPQLDLGLFTTGTLVLARQSGIGCYSMARRSFNRLILAGLGIGAVLAVFFWLVRAPIFSLLNLTEVFGERTNQISFAICIWILASFLSTGAQTGLRARERFRLLAVFQGVSGSAFWILAACFSLFRPDIAYTVYAVGLATTIISIITFILVHHDLRKPDSGSAGDQKWPAKFALGIFGAQISTQATYQIDRLLVSAFLSPAAAGAYGICVNIANKIMMVVAAVGAYTLPRAARLQAQGQHEALGTVYAAGSRVALITAVFVAAPLIALAEPVLRAWMGENFAREYAGVLQLLVIAYAINSTSIIASNVASGMLNARLNIIFATLGGALTVGFCSILTPNLGSVGAALAAIVGMSQALVFNYLIAKRVQPPSGIIDARFCLTLAITAAAINTPLLMLGQKIHQIETAAVALLVGGLTQPVLWFAFRFAGPLEQQMASGLVPWLRRRLERHT